MSSKYKNSEIMGSRTLHIGDLEAYMDESYIASLFRKTGKNFFLFVNNN